eukprot:6746807-Lingulodinium_polyedra.AAC.1
MASYLWQDILVDGKTLSAEWQSSVFDVMPGFAVYVSNDIERQWRTIKGMMPQFQFQDCTTCMRRLSDAMSTRLRDG